MPFSRNRGHRGDFVPQKALWGPAQYYLSLPFLKKRLLQPERSRGRIRKGIKLHKGTWQVNSILVGNSDSFTVCLSTLTSCQFPREAIGSR